jgi:hypothetical protein
MLEVGGVGRVEGVRGRREGGGGGGDDWKGVEGKMMKTMMILVVMY